MFQLNKATNNISSILGSEVKIKGDVSVSGDLLIYGKVFGNIIIKVRQKADMWVNLKMEKEKVRENGLLMDVAMRGNGN